MAEITQSQVDELRRFQKQIDHTEEVVQYLKHGEGVIIAAITGPSAAGSTTLINKSGLRKVPGFTSRPPRYDGENEIRFFDHTSSFIDDCIDRCKTGEIVQIRVSDEGYIYGSEIEDYKRGVLNVVDMTADSILKLHDLPFKAVRPIMVVCDADQWEARFLRERGEFTLLKDRIQNDIRSMKTAIAQDKEKHPFAIIINNDGESDQAADELTHLAHGEVPDSVLGNFEERRAVRDALLGRMALVIT